MHLDCQGRHRQRDAGERGDFTEPRAGSVDDGTTAEGGGSGRSRQPIGPHYAGDGSALVDGSTGSLGGAR